MFLAIKKETKFVPIFSIIETIVIIDYVQCPSEIYIRNKETEEIPDNKASNNMLTLYTRLQVHHIVSKQQLLNSN